MSSPVPQRRLGRSGLIVSRLCLGTMQFGARTEEADARRIVDHAADHGVNFIDTADTYVNGVSEEIVGRAIAAKRDYWVLATKLAVPIPGEGPNRKGLSRKWIMEEADASLKRLGTDFIDILYLHREDAGTPLEETVRALGDLQRAGKIRYFGLSNFKAWRMARVCSICDSEGLDRPVVNQPVYHALNRSIEAELLPACADLGLGVFPYSPNARGILSGKYAPHGIRIPAGEHHGGRGHRGPCQEAWDRSDRLRRGLGARQSHRHRRHRGSAHPRAVGKLPGGV